MRSRSKLVGGSRRQWDINRGSMAPESVSVREFVKKYIRDGQGGGNKPGIKVTGKGVYGVGTVS